MAKTFLECMFNDLDDISEGSDEEVKNELNELGIDVEKSRCDMLDFIKRLKEGDV